MIIRSVISFLATNWKVEVAVTAIATGILTGIGLLANAVTSPHVLAVMVTVAEIETNFTKQLVISGISSAVTLMLVWWLQVRIQGNREKRLDAEKEERDRLAEDQVTLRRRVTEAEKIIADFKEKLSLLDQASRPLFEAAKIRLIDALTHPHAEFKIPDELLADVRPPGSHMTPKLAELLKERETSNHPEVTPEEKLAAAILPKIIELAAIEAKIVGPVETQVVSSPTKASEEAKKLA